MISKRTHPMIGRLSELLVSGTGVNHRTGFLDVTMTTTTTSPRSPLEYRIQSPTRIGGVGLKNYDIGGVGLGIVAALEKSCNFIPKFAIPAASKSDPIPVLGAIETDPDSLEEEDYTYVTNHGPEKSFTKVYYDGGVSQRHQVSPALPPARPPVAVAPLYSTPDFLSSCHLCVKKLHGKDIYMYREKAFCSNECRSRQIMNDERKEQCRSEVTRSGEVVSTSSPIFSTGILAI